METLTWEKLEEHISLGRPSLLPMGGTKNVVVGFDPAGSALFIRMVLDERTSVPASPYSELIVEARRSGKDSYLEISTTTRHLYKEFHRLAGLLTEEFERKEQTAVGAFSIVIGRWRELSTRRDLLAPDEQLGLIGELCVLAALLRHDGPRAVSAWTGRLKDLPDRHDFRLGSFDLEVKSTRSARRQHVIHGLRQLEPSGDHSLYLLSLRFDAAGTAKGLSLSERVLLVQALLKERGAEEELRQLTAKLESARYRDADSGHYQDRFRLADSPILIPVDDKCPRLVMSSITAILGTGLGGRIGADVVYRIDVEGLGEVASSKMPAPLSALGKLE